jgi:hypothetical protein
MPSEVLEDRLLEIEQGVESRLGIVRLWRRIPCKALDQLWRELVTGVPLRLCDHSLLYLLPALIPSGGVEVATVDTGMEI